MFSARSDTIRHNINGHHGLITSSDQGQVIR